MASTAVGVATGRYLGVTVARGLTWSAHEQSDGKEDDTEAWRARRSP